MKKNTLCPQDHSSLEFHERLKDEKVKAYANLSVNERIKYFHDHNIPLEPYHLDRVRRVLSDARKFSDLSYPKPKGPLNVNHVILGEVHDQAENWQIYSTLFKGLTFRGYTNLTFEFANSKESQDRLNEAFLLANSGQDSSTLEDRIFKEGTVPALVYAIQNNMRITFVDSLDRDSSPWNKETVPNIPFDPEDPNTIIDEDSIKNKAKLDAGVLHSRNLHMATGIGAFDQEKVIHIGGRDHNKGLQSILEQKTGLTPLSLLIDYPSHRLPPEEFESHHAYGVEYVRDILTLVDNLTESSPSKNLGFIPSDVDDSPGSEASPERVRAYLLSGLVGQIMSKAAALTKGAPEHQSRIFMTMLVALDRVSILDVDVEKSKQLLFRANQEKENKGREKRRKKEKEEEKKKKLEELEERLKREELEGTDLFSIFDVFRSLVVLPSIAPSLVKDLGFLAHGQSDSFDFSSAGRVFLEEVGINSKDYFSEPKVAQQDIEPTMEIS